MESIDLVTLKKGKSKRREQEIKTIYNNEIKVQMIYKENITD